MSWVIVNISTDKSVCELTNKKNVDRINTEKYKAVPILEYLVGLNKK